MKSGQHGRHQADLTRRLPNFNSVVVQKTPADKAKVAKARELEKANAAKAKEEG